MAEAPHGIQATLFDYFQDTEYFDLQEANELLLKYQNRDINTESIRARIYEGIDKGLFERVGKGLYTVTRKDEQGRENTCLLINGDGRDLSMLPDDSVDALITDHPYQLTASLKGGNRNFADYDLFQYDEKDMSEKARILKPGCFCVEFLPEENGDNYRYLYRIKEMAHKAGLEYYCKVPWQKQGFVANTGRKSKDTEDICFFTKGKARTLRPDAKKDKQYAASRQIVEFKEFIPGSTTVHASEMGGLGTSCETNIAPINVNIRLSVAKEDADKVKLTLDQAWDNAVVYSCEDSPLDKDNGGAYSYEDLFNMPVQEYMLKFLETSNISFVDLSPGPENIFDSTTQVIVNPVNLIGPMGAGLAKEFKERYPDLEEKYKESCRQRQFTGAKDFKSPIGTNEILISDSRAMFEGNLFLTGSNNSRPSILCFPTKRDWRDPSDLALIEAGLKTFVQNYKHFNIKSITFPKLGCGLGGLNWEKEVKPLMQKYLGSLPDLDVRICGDTLKVDKKEHFMSGAHGMLPTSFSVEPPHKSERIHQAEKPLELLMQILEYVTLPGETALDQFAGSGVLGEAALKTGRNSILIEKEVETFQKIAERLQVLGKIEAVTSAQRDIISIGSDALVAKDAYYRTGDESIVTNFVDTHDIKPKELHAAHIDMHLNEAPGVSLSKEEKLVMAAAMDAIKYLDFKAESLKKAQETEIKSGEALDRPAIETPAQKVLECSSRGDRRFSALFANVNIKGKEQSIEVWYQNAKRTEDGKKAGKGKPFDHIICPFTGDKLPADQAGNLYKGLWITYLTKNPDLVEYAKGFDEFHDMFRSKGTVNCQADVIAAYVTDSDSFVGEVKKSAWYQNMASKKKPLDYQIRSADHKAAEQMNLFSNESQFRGHWNSSR